MEYLTCYYLYLLSCVLFFCEAGRISRRDVVFRAPTYSGAKTERSCNWYTTLACDRILTSQQNTKNSSTEFPDKEYHIVGGRLSLGKEYPHMALMGYGNYPQVKWLCGGSLISENFVLSAAHCATSNVGAPTWLRMGTLDSYNAGNYSLDKPITQVIVHPDYKRHNGIEYNDIALLKFESISFSEYIRPICLNIFQELPNQNVTVAGWGSTGYGETGSSHLLSVDLDLQKSEQCDSLYHGFNASTQICAGYAPGGRDSCQGDSGGPLLMTNYGAACTTVPIYKQIGIVSFGENCALPNTPGVYTRVSYFIPWIESIVWT